MLHLILDKVSTLRMKYHIKGVLFSYLLFRIADIDLKDKFLWG